ncbi:MAG TPA: TonB-dependent receptor [Polyangiaceae bacterium]|nr:TonB-dependent receptor [Polyangiaceae bacterium]
MQTKSGFRRSLARAGLLFTLLSASPALADGVVPPKVVTAVPPEFPASETVDTAEVVLALSIDETGAVTDATVLTSGGAAFDAAALAVAKQFRFEPARRGDRAVAARIPFTVRFERPHPEEPATPVVAPPPSTSKEPKSAPVPKPATPSAAPETEEEPEEVSVRGEKTPREPTTRTLTGAEIRNAPGTNGDLLRSVENLPGVARPSGIDGQLLVRGSGPADTGAFLDGTWIIGAYHFGGITSVVPSELIERLDFHPGNFSTEYGRLMGGIVELELRSPRKDRLGGLVQVDLLDARALIEGPISKKTRFAAAARRSWIDAWLGSAAGDAVIAAPVYYDYQAMLEHDVSKDVTARLSVYGSDDRMKLLFDSPDAQDPAGGGTLAAAESFYRIAGRVDARLSPDVHWVNKVSYGQNDQSFDMGTYRAGVTFDIITARSDLRLKVAEGLALVGGFDGLFGNYDISLRIPQVPNDGSPSDGPVFARPAPSLHGKGFASRPAAYAMLEARPFSRLLVTPGVRVDYMSDTGNVTVDPRVSARFDLATGPRRTTLKGAYGFFHQAPDPSESIQPFGTPGIHSAYAEHASFGVEQSFDGLVELSVEAFGKRFHDLVVEQADETGSQSGVRYANTGAGRAFGVEWLAKWTGGGRFSGFLSYTLSRSERRSRDDEAYHLFQYDQTHILTAVGGVDLGRGWSVGSRFRYVTGSPYTPYVGSAVDFDAGAYAPVSSTRQYSSRSAPFHKLDVRVEKRWQLGVVKLAAYLDVQNVYNHRSEEGRVYSYDYAKSEPLLGLPILPILGVRGEL